jgi:hypothetical protein
MVLYEDDSVAGFKSGAAPVGPWSHNPIIAHKVPVDLILAGVAEPRAWTGEVSRQRFGVRVQNPVRDGFAVLTLSGPAARWSGVLVRVSISDAAGRQVWHSSFDIQTSSFPLDLRSTPAGVYLVELRAGSTAATTKLVVQR